MKTPRLSNTGIEYLDKVWNFTSGCKKGCSYCYAKKITERFTNHYPYGFEPTLYPEAMLSPLYLKKPSRIGVCFMGDLFCDCPEFDPNRMINVPLVTGLSEARPLKEWLFKVITACPQHTFIFLTKQPQNLIKFSPFPDNCFVGQTITQNLDGIGYMADFEARVKFISFEPLLYYNVDVLTASELFRVNGIKQVIIGGQTKPTRLPEIASVKLLVEATDKAGVKVFLKNNLEKLAFDFKWPEIKKYWCLFDQIYYADDLIVGADMRQEMPC